MYITKIINKLFKSFNVDITTYISMVDSDTFSLIDSRYNDVQFTTSRDTLSDYLSLLKLINDTIYAEYDIYHNSLVLEAKTSDTKSLIKLSLEYNSHVLDPNYRALLKELLMEYKTLKVMEYEINKLSKNNIRATYTVNSNIIKPHIINMERFINTLTT